MIGIGVDPGGTFSAVVTKERDKVLTACVLKRTTGGSFPDAHYINEVLDEITNHIENADFIALEGVVEPEPHMGLINVAGIIGTGIVFGAVLARWPRAVIVPPGGNGSLPDHAYPQEIRKLSRLGGPTKHARSAYDVARVGEVLYRASRSTTRGQQ